MFLTVSSMCPLATAKSRAPSRSTSRNLHPKPKVVLDEEVGPAVPVVIQHGHAQGLRTAVEHAAGGGNVLEGAVAAIVKQPAGIAAIGFRRAIRLGRAIETAKHVGFRTPANVIADEDIEEPVAVVIKPQRGGAEALATKQRARAGGLDEGSFAGVAKEAALADASDENVGEAIVVVIADGHAHSVHLDVKPHAFGDIGKSAVAIVAVETQGRAPALVAGPVHAIDEQNVLPAVGVVIQK